MMTDTRQPQHNSRRFSRRWFAVVCAAGLIALVGCKSNKDSGGIGNNTSRDKNDPLLASSGNLIPKQNVPIPDRATGPKGRPDPLKTTPTGNSSDKIGYNASPDRFKGTVVLSTKTTPAALTNRIKDGEELKIDDGVPLTPAGGALPGGTLEPPPDVEPLYAQLEKLGIKREDCSLARENGKLVFRASVLTTSEGPRTQYSGAGDTAAEAITQVLKQLK